MTLDCITVNATRSINDGEPCIYIMRGDKLLLKLGEDQIAGFNRAWNDARTSYAHICMNMAKGAKEEK